VVLYAEQVEMSKPFLFLPFPCSAGQEKDVDYVRAQQLIKRGLV